MQSVPISTFCFHLLGVNTPWHGFDMLLFAALFTVSTSTLLFKQDCSHMKMALQFIALMLKQSSSKNIKYCTRLPAALQ
jgi:hypothetical protein